MEENIDTITYNIRPNGTAIVPLKNLHINDEGYYNLISDLGHLADERNYPGALGEITVATPKIQKTELEQKKLDLFKVLHGGMAPSLWLDYTENQLFQSNPSLKAMYDALPKDEYGNINASPYTITEAPDRNFINQGVHDYLKNWHTGDGFGKMSPLYTLPAIVTAGLLGESGAIDYAAEALPWSKIMLAPFTPSMWGNPATGVILGEAAPTLGLYADAAMQTAFATQGALGLSELIDNDTFGFNPETINNALLVSPTIYYPTKCIFDYAKFEIPIDAVVNEEMLPHMSFYHGSPNANIEEFRPGTYFTTNPDFAKGYTGFFNLGRIYLRKLNFDNPVFIDNGGRSWATIPEQVAADALGLSIEELNAKANYNKSLLPLIYRIKKALSLNPLLPNYAKLYRINELVPVAEELGFDGLIVNNVVDSGKNFRTGPRNTSLIVALKESAFRPKLVNGSESIITIPTGDKTLYPRRLEKDVEYFHN